MWKYTNKVLGGLLATLINLPLILLTTAFSLLIFIDNLLQLKPISALGRLLLSFFLMTPATFAQLVYATFKFAYQEGLVNYLKSSIHRISYFFKSAVHIRTDFFLVSRNDTVLFFYVLPGNYMGAITRKLCALCLPYQVFDSFDHLDQNPHNAEEVAAKDAVYNKLIEKYQAPTNERINETVVAVNQFLNSQIEEARANNDNFAEALIKVAQRCIDNFLKNPGLRASDIKSKPSASETLVLVWAAFNAESGSAELLTKNRKLFMQYLIQIQHSRSIIENTNDADAEQDYPDCPTGTVGLLLDSLKILGSDEYYLQAEVSDSYVRLNQMLNMRLNNSYKPNRYYDTEKNIESHKKEHKDTINTYAHFLLESPQGLKLFKGNNASLTHLNNQQIEDTVDEVLRAWEPAIA